MTRLTCIPAVVLTLLCSHCLRARTLDTRDEVPVCLQLDTQPDTIVLLQGKAVAADVFRTIGIELHWACSADSATGQPQAIVASLTSKSRFDPSDDALGFARPFAQHGPQVVVLYDRMLPLSSEQPMNAGTLLGYVLVHEIGHVLSGVAAHTESGLMGPHWTSADLHSIFALRMKLSADDEHLIRTRAGRRMTRPRVWGGAH